MNNADDAMQTTFFHATLRPRQGGLPSRGLSPIAYRLFLLLAAVSFFGAPSRLTATAQAAEPTPTIQAEAKNLTVEGQVTPDKARLVIQADLKPQDEARDKTLYGTSAEHSLRIGREKILHTAVVRIQALQGNLRETVLRLSGEGEIRQVTADGLENWSVTRSTNGENALVLRMAKTEKPVTNLTATITAETRIEAIPQTLTPLAFSVDQPALFHGYVRIDIDPDLSAELSNPTGVAPIDPQFLPEPMRAIKTETPRPPLAYRFQGAPYKLPLQIAAADPEAWKVVVRDFKLVGDLKNGKAGFTLTATAKVRNPKGGRLDLLSGAAALTETEGAAGWRLVYDQGRFVAVFDKAGEFAIRVRFDAAVHQTNGWNEIGFWVAPSTVQPVTLEGLREDTQFKFEGGASLKRTNDVFVSFLPSSGDVKLAWKEARQEAEGRLFYSVEALSQITVSPGMLRQTEILNFKVMQGELAQVVFTMRGEGEITRVQGQQVLAWTVEPAADGKGRRLVVRLNQAQKEQFAIAVQIQSPLGAFPQSVDAVELRPESSTRYGGYLRVLNEGAVRLEILKSTGLSQISPEQFPQTDATKALVPPQNTQAFAYRFSGADYQLRVQADNILPEIGVSEILTYHLAETELAIQVELELDIREAPLREVQLRVPRGFVIANLAAPGLGDHFLTEPADQPDSQLRLVYAAPVSGRQVVQLRLERNSPLGATEWVLPRVEVLKAKSTRGHVGISADAGFRLSTGSSQGLTEVATAFFPKKTPGIQAAFRISDPAWQAKMLVERLAQSIQADAFHLFSVGEGIAYGSSVINYLISGAPMGTFQIELSPDYANVEFTGKDVRNWQKTTNGYQVQLHSPVSGSYTLLATYERPFKPQGETLTFTGARALNAQTEQGHTVVVSTYQFQVRPANTSAGLMAIEPGELPPEYRLLFDAPILAAYRYTARPYNLQLELKPLAQAATVGQVVDRASLETHISSEGQVLTDARYFVKSKGTPHFRVTAPEGMQLWAVAVNGAAVVPVTDNGANLIPLPQHTDPNTVNEVTLKLAATNSAANRVTVTAPKVTAPILLTEWRVLPDTGRRLVYTGGTLKPSHATTDDSGFASLEQLIRNADLIPVLFPLGNALGLLLLACFAIRISTGDSATKFFPRHIAGGLLAAAACVGAMFFLARLWHQTQSFGIVLPNGIELIAPIQQADSLTSITVANVKVGLSSKSVVFALLPAVLAIIGWFVLKIGKTSAIGRFAPAVIWTLILWSTLRLPQGLPWFVVGFGCFVILEVVLRLAVRWWKGPSGQKPDAPGGTVAAATLALLLAGPLAPEARPQNSSAVNTNAPAIANVVRQEVRVENEFVRSTVHLQWQAGQGQRLPILGEPGVLTGIQYPTESLRLYEDTVDGQRNRVLLAEKAGLFDIELQYESHAAQQNEEHGFRLPTPQGLVNTLRLTVVDQNVNIRSPEAVSIREETKTGTNTVAALVLGPSRGAWIGWKPRSRDTRSEKAVFYAELVQLYVPGAGMMEGLHEVQIRPAQGELGELAFEVPVGATITDVNGPAISVWRFDPDAHTLRVTLATAQSKPFTVQVRSQMATGPLPSEITTGLLQVRQAAGQVGLAGVASGNEVQIENVEPDGLSPINLEDFPVATIEPIRAQTPELALRRAFRYSESKGTLKIKAAAVEPDIRVESQTTLSLSEDRTVLAATLAVEITRAGIFKLSFPLPAGMDVESIGGGPLSHWTDLKTDNEHVVTLHLKGRTGGNQQFTISLAGPGVRATTNWAVPRLTIREAGKQRGQYLVVPEQGMRLQPSTREGVTQLDPQKSGIRQKGVLTFRILQNDWKLGLDIEQVSAWTQVTSLQHVTVSEAQLKVRVNLQYQIENAGAKVLRVRLPLQADGVRFTGDQVADFLPVEGATNATHRVWEIKLHRRVTSRYTLQAAYNLPVAADTTGAIVAGVQAMDVDLQRGFLTVESSGRLQVRIDAPPPALQPSEWQSVPRQLQQDIEAASANFTFRLVDPEFLLPIKLEKHEAARLLPARVNSVTLRSAVSDDGMMLTHAAIELVPGDKRLLRVSFPAEGKFWFAFVNQNSVWPWREDDAVLIPLEQRSRTSDAIKVEFFYSQKVGEPGGTTLRLKADGPKLDLPLERISWQLFLSDKWRLTDWKGSLQLQNEQQIPVPIAVDLNTYIRNETNLQNEKTKEAEQMLALANGLLQQGDPQQARRAFNAAYGLSQHNEAFNEDARVQLHNLKMQQALVGLNVRQAKVAGESAQNVAPRAIREGRSLAYSQAEAKQLLDNNTAEDTAWQTHLAEKLIQQQDAAIANPASIRASIPEQGRVLTFTRPLQVDAWADLRLEIVAKAARSTLARFRLLALLPVLLVAALLVWAARGRKARPTTA